MSKYSELVADLRRGVEFDMRRDKPFCIRDAAADAITKLEAEKAELVECVKLLMRRCGPLAPDGHQARQLLAKLEAGQ
ncbi:hypothetical protein [Sphingobium fuliginis]|uniref:hypothetical protein n=1 Tax=Sphingobium fuliginis (strain ATCC 27551) TaxID=336203 RepID=UPI0037CAE289